MADELLPIAIIVPAYRSDFLRQALGSLAEQTCKDFTVYLGDDASPSDLQCIAREFGGRMDLVYHRFESNLGGSDLVGQWERCVGLSRGEELLWLFSDDDIASGRCVENLLRAVADEPEADVYHFDIEIIDRDGRVRRSCRPFPARLGAGKFLALLFRGEIDARMPEFVFRSKALRERGGFERFDLAFRTDTATVAKIAGRAGIATVPGAKVKWRDSGSNVSSRPETSQVLRRVRATVEFFDWVDEFLARESVRCPLGRLERLRVVLENASPLVPAIGMSSTMSEVGRLRWLRRRPGIRILCRAFLLFQSTFYPNNRGL